MKHIEIEVLICIAVAIALVGAMVHAWLQYAMRKQAERQQAVLDRAARLKALASREAMQRSVVQRTAETDEFLRNFNKRWTDEPTTYKEPK